MVQSLSKHKFVKLGQELAEPAPESENCKTQ
jgi:hypothetical protein